MPIGSPAPILLDTCALLWASDGQPMAKEAQAEPRGGRPRRGRTLRLADQRMGNRELGFEGPPDPRNGAEALVPESSEFRNVIGGHAARPADRIRVSAWIPAAGSCRQDPGRHCAGIRISAYDEGCAPAGLWAARPHAGHPLLIRAPGPPSPGRGRRDVPRPSRHRAPAPRPRPGGGLRAPDRA